MLYTPHNNHYMTNRRIVNDVCLCLGNDLRFELISVYYIHIHWSARWWFVRLSAISYQNRPFIDILCVYGSRSHKFIFISFELHDSGQNLAFNSICTYSKQGPMFWLNVLILKLNCAHFYAGSICFYVTTIKKREKKNFQTHTRE